MSVDEFDEHILIGGLGKSCAMRVEHMLRDHFITHVVVCGKPEQEHVKALYAASKELDDIHIHLVDVTDHSSEDLAKHFDQASKFLEAATEDDMNRALVCCREGASRSVSVLVAHLMRTRHVSLKEAFDAVAHKRWRLWPNMGFIQQLLTYQDVANATRDATLAHLASHVVWATAKHNGKDISKDDAMAAWMRAAGDEATRLESAKLDVLGVGAMKKAAPTDVTEVDTGLFLGGLGDKTLADITTILKDNDITHLVVCGNLARDTHASLCKDLTDVKVHKCCLPQPDELAHLETAELERAVSFVQASCSNSQTTLVACSKGASRSVSVILAVLMIRRNLSLRQAFDLVASKRWRLWPNWRLVEHLIARDTGDHQPEATWRHIGSYAALATCWHNGRQATLQDCYDAWDRRKDTVMSHEQRFLAVKEDVIGVGDLDSYELVERPDKRPRLQE